MLFIHNSASTKDINKALFEDNNYDGNKAYEKWQAIQDRERSYRLNWENQWWTIPLFYFSVYNLIRYKKLSNSGRSLAIAGTLGSWFLYNKSFLNIAHLRYLFWEKDV